MRKIMSDKSQKKHLQLKQPKHAPNQRPPKKSHKNFIRLGIIFAVLLFVTVGFGAFIQWRQSKNESAKQVNSVSAWSSSVTSTPQYAANQPAKEYVYGGGKLVAVTAPVKATPITQHDQNYTQETGQVSFCYFVCPCNSKSGDAKEDYLNPCSCPLEEVCEISTNLTFYRGNVTKITAYSDATIQGTDPNALVTTAKYGIAGNMVASGVNCCNLKTWTYTSATHYAYPMTEATGDSGQLTTSATYDLNSGLLRTAIDSNNQITSLAYDPNTLRMIRRDSPNGALNVI